MKIEAIETRNWKFYPGQKVILVNLVDFPEREGEIVTIFGYRPVIPNGHCPSGNAYYISGEKPGNYFYEERLSQV